MTRLTVLTFVAHYLPGFRWGGPVRTIANMVEHLADEVDFRIVTADRDVGDTVPYPEVAVNAWNRVGEARVFYAPPGRRSTQAFARLMEETPHDVLYLNSFFHPVFTIRPLLARRLGLVPRRPCVIAPRGEFSPGALSLKGWKKRPYIVLSRLLSLYDDVRWQASSEREAEDIRRSFGAPAASITVAPNLPPPAVSYRERRGPRDAGASLRVCFLSRIAPKKNLDFALRVLARVSVPVEFDIYGPVSHEAYWQRCRALMRDLPAHVKVVYHGEVSPETVMDVFAAHDLFLFPTRGENFGHVILEALSAGTPVLTSDQTPWTAQASEGCMALPLERERSFTDIIEDLAGLGPIDLERRREAAWRSARGFARADGAAERNLELFRDAAIRSADSGGGAPE